MFSALRPWVPADPRTRRQAAVLVLSALATAAAGLGLPATWAVAVVWRAGYWIVAALVAVWGVSAFRALRGFSGWRDLLRREAPAWVLLLLLAGLTARLWPGGFLVLYDEPALSATGLGMHLRREPVVLWEAWTIDGAWQETDYFIDKRPFLFPFLVSLAHDLTGYRLEQAMLLNGLLLGVGTTLLLAAGRLAGGGRWTGWLAALLWLGVPLVHQSARGGGFELLNQALLLGVLLTGHRFWIRPDGPRLELFVYTSLLLGQCRYESILWMPMVALLVAARGWRDRRLELTWATALAPLGLLLYLLHHHVFALNPDYYQLADKPGGTALLSWPNFTHNLVAAARFFTDAHGLQPNSPAVLAVGLAAPLLWLLSRFRRPSPGAAAVPRPDLTVAVVWTAFLGALTIFLLSYFYGEFDNPLVRRLSLPTHLLLILPAVWILGRAWAGAMSAVSPLRARVLPGLLIFTALLVWPRQTIPFLQSGRLEQGFYPPLLERAREEWHHGFLADRTVYLLDHSPVTWTLRQRPALQLSDVATALPALRFHFHYPTFQAIYVVQLFLVDSLGRTRVHPEFAVPPELRLAPERIAFCGPGLRAVLSRVVAIDGPDRLAETLAGLLASVPPEQRPLLRREFWRRCVPR